MARHTTIAKSLGAPVYFCDSHSPWQRGSNENANGLLRDYFPKSTDLGDTSRHVRGLGFLSHPAVA
jgi:IS30 family transposase